MDSLHTQTSPMKSAGTVKKKKKKIPNSFLGDFGNISLRVFGWQWIGQTSRHNQAIAKSDAARLVSVVRDGEVTGSNPRVFYIMIVSSYSFFTEWQTLPCVSCLFCFLLPPLPSFCLPGSFNFIFHKSLQSSTVEPVLTCVCCCCCCSVPQLNVLRVTLYMHPHLNMHTYRCTA